VRLASSALAALAVLAAGCSGGGEESTPTTPTTAPTVTVTTTAAPTPTPTADPGSADALADAVARVLPSVVHVRTESFGGGRGEGSGVVIAQDGLVVTNNHVVEGTTRVTVHFNDDRHARPLRGTVVGTAPEQDLAVVRVQANDLIPLERGRSSTLRLGDPVFAVGFPLDLGGPTVTSGIVSGLDRTVETRSAELTGLLQTDAAINPGNSGGPLVDRAGRLVGINTAGVRLPDTENIGFAIAIDHALPVIERLRGATPTTEAWLGVDVVSVDSDSAAAQLGLDSSVRGAAVTVVYPGGPGAKAELAVGDVITVADDVPINSAPELAKLLSQRKPGDELDLELLDSRGPRLVTVRLVRRSPGGALP
jgi:S1-C subfamily serine protease